MFSSLSNSIVARMVLVVSLVFCFQAVAEDKRVVVGVFSPVTGDLSDIGAAQEYLVKKGFQEAGMLIELNGSSVRIELKTIDTKSKADRCRANLDNFKNNFPDGVAIIGPVQSGCVQNMLVTDPQIPIISAMSSATHLTHEIQPQWFFRANITDRERLQKLSEFVAQSKAYREKTPMLVYDSITEYGKGLMKDFLEIWGGRKKIDIRTVDDFVKDTTDLKELLSNKNLFLLGSAEKTLSVAKKIRKYELEEKIDALKIFSVGSPSRLSEFRSERLITIGEVDFGKSNSVLVEREFKRIEQNANSAGHTFYPTIYATSRYIVYNALKDAIRKQVGDDKERTLQNLDAEGLRGLIREELEEESFPSPNPFRPFKFSPNHNLEADFDYPIYQLGWELKRLNEVSDDRRWIELIEYNRDVRFLETPAIITVVGHNLSETDVMVQLKDSGGNIIRASEFNQDEPPRICRRLHFLRGWSNEQTQTLSPGDPGTGRAPCP